MSYYSNVYWHFTGSPSNIDWSLISCPDDIKKYGVPKADEKCLEILESIFLNMKLLAKSREKVAEGFVTAPFCCVTDIPLQHLNEHKQYYGNIAIGFKHEKVHQQFNPVLYLPKQILPVGAMQKDRERETRSMVLRVFPFLLVSTVMDLAKSAISVKKSTIENDILYRKSMGSYIMNHFKITDFSDMSGKTFYREREWRKIGDFEFEIADIAAVIVPSKSMPIAKQIVGQFKGFDFPLLSWEFIEKM